MRSYILHVKNKEIALFTNVDHPRLKLNIRDQVDSHDPCNAPERLCLGLKRFFATPWNCLMFVTILPMQSQAPSCRFFEPTSWSIVFENKYLSYAPVFFEWRAFALLLNTLGLLGRSRANIIWKRLVLAGCLICVGIQYKLSHIGLSGSGTLRYSFLPFTVAGQKYLPSPTSLLYCFCFTAYHFGTQYTF